MTELLRQDSRAVSPVVGKSLVVALTLLYVTGTTGLLLGTTVPAYEATAGDELGDRVLSTAASEIERAVRVTDGDLVARSTVDLPPTIQNSQYRLVVSGETLRLEHPDDQVGDEIRLALPPGVTVADGVWESRETLVLRVRGPAEDRVLAVGDGS